MIDPYAPADGDDLESLYWFVATQTTLRFDDLTFPQVEALLRQQQAHREAS